MHLAVAASEELLRLSDKPRVLRLADKPDARRGAPLDLVQQAWPRALLINTVGARAQQKGLLQCVQCAVHRSGGGEGAIIVARAFARAAMLENLGRAMVGCDEDIGKGFVVAQQHVVTRLELLDVVGFEQQRLGFRRRDRELHRAGFRDHPHDAVRVPARLCVARYARFQVFCLANIEHRPVGADHAIDAGFGGQPLDLIRDQFRARKTRGLCIRFCRRLRVRRHIHGCRLTSRYADAARP